MAQTRCLITSYFLKPGDEGDGRLREAGVATEFQPRQGARDEDEVIRIAQGCDAVIASIDPFSARVLAALSRLKIISRTGVGYDSIDLVAATARGGLIDQAALYAALKERKIAGAAMDAFEQEPLGDTPLRGLDNCWLSPHAAGSSRDAHTRSKHMAVENVLRFFRGERPLHIVNPEVLEA